MNFSSIIAKGLINYDLRNTSIHCYAPIVKNEYRTICLHWQEKKNEKKQKEKTVNEMTTFRFFVSKNPWDIVHSQPESFINFRIFCVVSDKSRYAEGSRVEHSW